jgi:2-polyprenyl-6-hydroxyphenyl methylase/3-demethylubiquinone-9 3-methyltransferase
MLKRMYNLSPRPVRSAWHAVFFPVIYVAKFLVTGRNPLCKERGMDFRCDLVDWLGGYPYEYARAGEIVRFVEGLGFSVAKTRTAEVPTGCNEFVCTRLRAMA